VSNWQKFWALSREERWLLLKALVLLPVAKRALRLGALRHLPRSTPRIRPQPGHEPAGAQGAEEARRVARMVSAAARNGPWRPTCLEQSVVLLWLLARQGIPAQLRIGVRKQPEALEAHAWVESGGVVLNDSADVSERYQPFEGDLATLVPFQPDQPA
jgi:Transglutaminase-like superfamily